jgi:hypothetical protein
MAFTSAPYELSVQPGTGPLPDMLATGSGADERERVRAVERERVAALAYQQARSWRNTPIGESHPRSGIGDHGSAVPAA